MTHAADLLAALESSGYALRVEDGRLLLSPASRLMADDRDAIAADKPALIWLLTDRFLGDYKHGDDPVEMADCRVDLGDGRKTLGDAAKWEAFAAWAKAHNDRAAELFAVSVKKRKKSSAKAARKQGRKQKAFTLTVERGGYAM